MELKSSIVQPINTVVFHSHFNDSFLLLVTIFILACFVGYYVVWRVTPALHTPLMAITNAISGIIIIGAIITLGPKEFTWSSILGFLGIVIASLNIFGGFIVTQRMLAMLKEKAVISINTIIYLFYLLSAILFILSLKAYPHHILQDVVTFTGWLQ